MSGKGKKTMTGVFIISCILQTMTAPSLVLSGVRDAFPDASVTTVQLVYSMLPTFSLIATLVVGKLTNIFRKKILVFVGCSMLLIGGLLGFFFYTTLPSLYIASAFIGFACGMMIPLVTGLIAEHFEGEERTRVLGIQAIFNNGGTLVTQFIGGLLVDIHFHYLYLIYFATIPVMICAGILLPKGIVEKPEAGEKVKVFTPFLALMMIEVFLVSTAFSAFLMNISLYITETNLATAGQVSYLTVGRALGNIICGLVFAKIVKAMGKYTSAVGALIVAASIWVIAFVPNFIVLVFASIVLGFGYGIFFINSNNLIMAKAHPAATTMSLSMFMLGNTVGSVLNPYTITQGAALINDQTTTRFILGAISATIVVFIALASANKVAAPKKELSAK